MKPPNAMFVCERCNRLVQAFGDENHELIQRHLANDVYYTDVVCTMPDNAAQEKPNG